MTVMASVIIPPDLRAEIDKTLTQFRQVEASRWHRELTICLLTPQSSPVRAEKALCVLEGEGFFAGHLGIAEIAKVLRTKDSYIRFHNQKASRVFDLRRQWPQIREHLMMGNDPISEREFLISHINGFGLKEASHALRNIGRTGLAILDRHILRKLAEHGVIETVPSTLSNKKYLLIENAFKRFSDSIQESMDVLDLFFWWQGTGLIFK